MMASIIHEGKEWKTIKIFDLATHLSFSDAKNVGNNLNVINKTTNCEAVVL